MSSIKQYISKITNYFAEQGNMSYSQSGEDLIIFLLATNILKLPKINYLDLGAYHPFKLSNTYLLYKKGSKGVCVEPNTVNLKLFKKYRPKDKIINCCVGLKETVSDFYLFKEDTMSTLDENEAQKIIKYTGYIFNKIIKVPVKRINDIIIENFDNHPIHFLNIDIEGYDREILQDLDWAKFKPSIICAETANHFTREKDTDLINYIIDKGYHIYSDTYINTIFVDKSLWEKRYKPIAS